MLHEETRDEFVGLPGFRQVAFEYEEAVIQAVKQQKVRLDSKTMRHEVTLHSPTDVERPRAREEKRRGKFLELAVGGIQRVRRHSAVRRRQHADLSGTVTSVGIGCAGVRRRLVNAALASALAKDEKGSANDGTVTAPESLTNGIGATSGRCCA